MRRVLVISDNPALATVLLGIIEQKSLSAIAKFEFRYSSVNKNPQTMQNLGFLPVNIKDSSIVDWVIASFDLVLSIHCKQIFPPKLVHKTCCINVHPGLNPYNRGWYPQVFSIINHNPIGATIHEMNEDIDSGPIIAQKLVEASVFDTSLTLYEKVQIAEISLLEQHIEHILHGEYQTVEPTSGGNYNTIDDYKKLCQLDLNTKGTLQSHIDLLRALSHGNFKNAFFIDENGQKVYVRIQLEPAVEQDKG